VEPSPQVVRILEQYLEELESGGRPDADELVAQHPDLAEALRTCLTSLNFLHETALNVGALDTAAQLPEAEGPSLRQLGDYRIIREIGRGGMGVVYEAEQTSLGRRVALKILPFAAACDPRQRERFKHEALAAAHLHHTNIVPVISVGCERGVHYYAMQYIEGQPLTDIIAELRGAGLEHGAAENQELSNPGSGLSRQVGAGTRRYLPLAATAPVAELSTERARTSPALLRKAVVLGIQAAEALEHAHQQGIIHRDIKPANLLVDLRGNLWITDFGLAHFQTGAGLTLTGDMVGTLRYMSPEQALAGHGLIDHRTDIYGLGATLYELFVWKPAFGGRNRAEVLRQIAFEEPLPLRRHDWAIPAELEIIIFKAIAKHPDERYGSSQEFADDLHRFLDDKPILARRPTLAQRVRKWSRRHKSLVAAGVVLLMVSLVILAVSTALIWRAERIAELERERAEQHFAQALETVDRMSRTIGLQPKPPGNLEMERKAIAEESLNFYLRLLSEKEADPDLRLKTAKAFLSVHNMRRQIGDLKGAEEAACRAIGLLSDLASAFPSNLTYRTLLASAEDGLGGLLRSAFIRQKEAEDLLLSSVALRESIVNESPGESEPLCELAGSFHHLGYLYYQSARAAEAELNYRKALDIYLKMSASFPKADTRDEQAQVCNSLGVLLQSMWRLPEAEQAHRRALQLIESRAAGDARAIKDHPERLRTLSRLATLWWLTGRPEEAERGLRELIADGTRKATEFPQAPAPRAELGLHHRQLGAVLEALGRASEADSQYRESAAMFEELTRESPDTASHWFGLAMTQFVLSNLVAIDRPPAARTLCQLAMQAFQRACELNPQNPDIHNVYARFLANCAIAELRDPPHAVELAKRALALTPGDPNIWSSLGLAHYRSGHWNDALLCLEKSVQLRRGGTSLDHFFLAMTYVRMGDKDQAGQSYARATAWLKATRRGTEAEYLRVRKEAEQQLGMSASK
jgi:serine/threonine protein kinase/Flp pilus assembly protein TadD